MSGDHSTYDFSRAIGEALVALGLIGEAEPDTLTVEEQIQYFRTESLVGAIFGNARGAADRLRNEVGWEPKHTAHDEFIKDLKEDAKAAAKKLKA